MQKLNLTRQMTIIGVNIREYFNRPWIVSNDYLKFACNQFYVFG
jgi:hypothetical protein